MKKVAWLRRRPDPVEISVITDPIPFGAYRATEAVKSVVRRARALTRRRDKPDSNSVPVYRGHHGVTRSLVAGLQKIGVTHNYNPTRLEDLSMTVVVLSGVAALQQMIRLKQRGYVRRLITGPNVMHDLAAFGGIMAAPEIDLHCTHVLSTKVAERFLPSLAGRCRAWAAGVDVSYWQPNGIEPRNLVVIYDKLVKGPTVPIEPYKRALEARGHEVVVLTYGTHSLESYRHAVSSAKLLVGFTRDESQGIAFAEAWACDVPTLMWRNSEPTYLGVAYHGSSSPYLTEATGRFFDDLDDFLEILSAIESGELTFSAREWCVAQMSDEMCARNMLSLAASI